MVEGKRIILVNGSQLLSEMLQRIINRAEDLTVVAKVADLSLLPSVIDREEADWVVFAQWTPGKLPKEIDALFDDYPSIQVLTITINTGKIMIDWNARHKKTIEVTTVEGLTKALRYEPIA